METRVIPCWLSIVLTVLLVLRAGRGDAGSTIGVPHRAQIDVVRIRAFGEDDLTVEGRVSGDGQARLSRLLGRCRLVGKTTRFAADSDQTSGCRVCAITRSRFPSSAIEMSV